MKTRCKLFLITLVVLFVLLTDFSVKAEEKQYSVNEANFYVELQKNGDALITESWEVEYTKGSFTRFYKDIYKDVSEVEEFSGVQVISCKINGRDATETDYIDRVDYHYYFEDNADSYTIHWFYGAEGETVTYEITYLLSDVVKETQGQVAMFCYRFVGVDFPKNIENTTTTIVLPEDADIDIRYSQADYEDVTNNKVVCQEENVSGLLKYKIATSTKIFEKLAYVSLEEQDTEETEQEIMSDSEGIGAYFKTKLTHIFETVFRAGLYIFLIGAVIVFLLRKVKKQREFEEFYRQNPNYFQQLSQWYISRDYHPSFR